MVGIFYFLVIAAILVISYSRQTKRSDKGTPLQPAKPHSQKQVSTIKTETAARRTYVPVQPASGAVTRKPAATTRPQSEAAPQSPYSFRSVEEVRRAFVWMEILQRKY